MFRYLECVSKNMKKLQPFGDVPKKLTLQLRRSFVATRTFSQALQEGKKVLAKILKIGPKDKCVEALTKMTSCPACQGLPAIRPCSSYCQNVMKGCLAHHAELGDSWDKYLGECWRADVAGPELTFLTYRQPHCCGGEAHWTIQH